MKTFNSQKLRQLTLASTVAVTAAWGSQTQAQTATDNLSVSATVVANCTISTAALAFGDYDGITANSTTDLDGTGTVTVTCTNGSPVEITLGQGANPATSSTDAAPLRRLTDGTNFLSYALFSDTGRSTAWGNTVDTDVAITGTGAAQDNTVYGSVDAGQNVPTGTYSDTVVATVSF